MRRKSKFMKGFDKFTKIMLFSSVGILVAYLAFIAYKYFTLVN